MLQIFKKCPHRISVGTSAIIISLPWSAPNTFLILQLLEAEILGLFSFEGKKHVATCIMNENVRL